MYAVFAIIADCILKMVVCDQNLRLKIDNRFCKQKVGSVESSHGW